MKARSVEVVGAKKLTHKDSATGYQNQGLAGKELNIFLPRWPLAHGAL